MTEKKSLVEAIAGSEIFLALATKNYLNDICNPNSEVAVQARLAKKLNKPVIILIATDLSQAGKLELERFCGIGFYNFPDCFRRDGLGFQGDGLTA